MARRRRPPSQGWKTFLRNHADGIASIDLFVVPTISFCGGTTRPFASPDGVRELMMARWGMPSPASRLEGKKSDPGVTNVRNLDSVHWCRWLGVESRCLVPFTSFSENETLPDGSKPPIWFALDETRPLAFFAGIWTRWTSVRKVKEGETTNDIFAFLTTEPNKVVKPFRPKAMPVILTTSEEIETWMTAPAAVAKQLQRTFHNDNFRIVARGQKQDGAPA
jgi:putative SOS response-associated peptidase YedK